MLVWFKKQHVSSNLYWLWTTICRLRSKKNLIIKLVNGCLYSRDKKEMRKISKDAEKLGLVDDID